MKRVCVLTVAALLVVPLSVAAQALPTSPAGVNASTAGHSIVLERVLVRINGEIITQSELVRRQIDAIRSRNVDTRNITDANVLKLMNDVTPQVLVDTINEMLMVQRGRELGGKFSDDLFKDGIENIKKDNKLDDAGLKQVMAQEGLTMEQLRENFERTYFVRQVQSEDIYRKMRVTEEELRQFYAAHKDEFTTPENVTLRELFVAAVAIPGNDVRPEENAIAKTKIDALRARAVAGEDFVALVQSSSDAATKAAGGLIGPLNLADINPTVKDLVANLKAGEISQPLAMPRGGYEIFKMESRETPVLLSFDKVKPEIEQKIRESRLDTETDKLIMRLRGQSVIEWKDDTYKQLYDRQIAQAASASK